VGDGKGVLSKKGDIFRWPRSHPSIQKKGKGRGNGKKAKWGRKRQKVKNTIFLFRNHTLTPNYGVAQRLGKGVERVSGKTMKKVFGKKFFLDGHWNKKDRDSEHEQQREKMITHS